MKKAKTRRPDCHPNRAHYAKGLCASCYHVEAKRKKTKHKEPVRVIHTHDVIRQVQQPAANMATKQEEKDEQSFFLGKVKEQEQDERKHTMATVTEKEEKPRDTVKGYAGPAGAEDNYPAPKYATELPEGSVISPVGVTRPPEPSIMDPYRKERSKDEQLAGKVLIKGKTHHGFEYERIVDILQPRTEKGMFQVFKAHFPDAVEEDFSAKPISDEDAVKLEKEWSDKMRGAEKDERDKKAKEYESGSSAKKGDKNG